MPISKTKTFKQRIESGELFSVEIAAQIIGISTRHLQKLCSERKVAHTRRLGSQYFMTLAQCDAAFETMLPTAQGTRR